MLIPPKVQTQGNVADEILTALFRGSLCLFRIAPTLVRCTLQCCDCVAKLSYFMPHYMLRDEYCEAKGIWS